MKINQKGFSAVEILIVVVVLCLIIGVGWLVYDRQRSDNSADNSSSNSSETSGQEPSYMASDTFKLFENSIYSVMYPDNWNLIDPHSNVQGDKPEAQLKITSPDYKNYEGQSLVEVERGAEIAILYDDLEDGESLDNPRLNQEFDDSNKFSGRKTQTVTVDGKQALQTEYEIKIEHSQYAVKTIIYKKDKKLTIYYIGSTASNATHRPAYDNLVQSFKLK